VAHLELAGDEFDQVIASVLPDQRVARLVTHLVPQLSTSSLAWIDELATRTQRYRLSLAEMRSAATDLAWLAREVGQRYPNSSDWDAVRTAAPHHRLVLAYVHGQRFRFDYKFEPLQAHTHLWLDEFCDDALVLALAAFACLGARSPRGLELFHKSVGAADADTKSRHVCLAAMWFADHVPDQPEIMLSLSNRMMTAGVLDSNVFYRRAYALRKLGRYEQALEEVDRAISLLDIGNNRVHQDYVRERELIIVTMQMQRYAETLTHEISEKVTAGADRRIEAAAAALQDKVEAAQQLVAESTLKVVEILGLFVTLVGFLVGSGAVVLQASSFTERALSMGLVVIGSLFFFFLLRVVIRTGRR
jgi:tetratricopeptide (TPR) repeat protein